MIRVEQLTKRYGSVAAIQDVSFEVARGEVVGFLGKNGAGKSTTMRILCGCIGATSGRALVDGQDVLENPTAVKRRIGYLPEVPPLYPNMIVRDYLEFAARIKGVDDPAAAASQAIDRVGPGRCGRSCHRPPVEGLPPARRTGPGPGAQARRAGARRAELGSGPRPAERESASCSRSSPPATAPSSSRPTCLSEIEAMCNRVVIIHKGQVVATDTVESLASAAVQTRIRLARPGPAALEALGAVPGVLGISEEDEGLLRLSAEADVREQIAAAAVPFGLLELRRAGSLEDVFLRLTS